MTTQTPPMSSTIPARFTAMHGAIQFPNAKLANANRMILPLLLLSCLTFGSECASERPRHIQTHNANLELLKIGMTTKTVSALVGPPIRSEQAAPQQEQSWNGITLNHSPVGSVALKWLSQTADSPRFRAWVLYRERGPREEYPMHVYEVRPRKDKRGVDLISDVLPFGRLVYGGPNATSNAVD